MGETVVVSVLLAIAVFYCLENERRLGIKLEASLARERLTMERLLAVTAALREAPYVTQGEAEDSLLGEMDEPDGHWRERTDEECEFLEQWEDAGVRQRWARFLDQRMAEGRQPLQALADAEMALQRGRASMDGQRASGGSDGFPVIREG